MKSLNVLALLFSACALAQNPRPQDSPEIFPILLAGFTQDVDNVQASVVSIANDVAVVTLSCGSPDCPLTPSPTLALPRTGGYRLNLGTVMTQTCAFGPMNTQSYDITDSRYFEATLLCTESTSGVDDTSQTVTYSGTEIHGGTVTLTGGLDKYSSAISSLYPSGIPSGGGAAVTTSSIAASSTSSGLASISSTTSDGPTSTSSTTSNISSTTGSASTSTTSSASSPSNAAGITSASYGSTWIGAVIGVFACAFL